MRILYILILSVLSGITFAQEKKSIEALYITQPISIDGVLNESVYSQVQPAKDFFQMQPYNGKPSYQPSEVYFFYDQSAVYVGAMLYDSPDSIYNFLSQRDDIGASDYFGVYFDPYNQGLVAYGFFITPAGVQTDIKAIKTEYDNEDDSWDAVWQSKTRLTDNGWVVEMKIPYSALRFSENGDGIWGMNMFRNIKRHASNNCWNLIRNDVSGFIHQQGILNGIKNVKPPVRLSFSPYAAGYAEFKTEESNPDYTYKLGMDLKYGISESFTLDMMLVPDFGQIQSDDEQLNLSPYELFYSEKRQFFTEGTELFNRGGIFYSRRIGASPKFAGRAKDALNDNEIIDYNPTETRLLNATKISGRTNKGWGLGFLNSMSLPSYATLKDTITGTKRDVLIQPFTNYNIAVIDKSLKNNSYISLINTNISMVDDPFNANVTATDFQIRNKKKTFAISGKGGVSIRNNSEHETGYFSYLSFNKNSGTWQYGITQNITSDDFNPNDLGYLRRNNELLTEAFLNYNIFDPFGIFKHMNITLWYDHARMYNPNALSYNMMGLNYHNCFMNNFSLNINSYASGTNYDYYEPRVNGRFLKRPWKYSYSVSLFSDGTKAFSGGLQFENSRRPEINNNIYSTDFSLDYRIGRHLILSYNTEFENNINDRGYVDKTSDNDTINFAKRNVRTIENVINASYTINNKAGITFRARHYWSSASNNEFFQLNENGGLNDDLNYKTNKDMNYNAFNIDLIFRWIFAPGSELSLAWKNSIYNDTDKVIRNYWDNFSDTWKSNQINSFSVRILYYIDYNYFRKKS